MPLSTLYLRCMSVLFVRRVLDDFYKTVLKKSIDMEIVDVTAIGNHQGPAFVIYTLG